MSCWAVTLLPKAPGNCIKIKVFPRIVIEIFIPNLGKENETNKDSFPPNTTHTFTYGLVTVNGVFNVHFLYSNLILMQFPGGLGSKVIAQYEIIINSLNK